EPDVLLGLQRFGRDDDTEALELELKARAAREGVQPAQQIALSAQVLVKTALQGRIEGELGVSPAAGGRLDLFYERRPLCSVPDALPVPLTAAVNCDRLTPTPAHDGVVRDTALSDVVGHLTARADVA